MSRNVADRCAWALAALVFVLALGRYDGPTRGYWDTYVTAPAMFMNRQPIDFVLADGTPAFRYDLQGRLPDDLVARSSFGIITKDQRLGGGVLASLPFAFLGLFGLRLLYAACQALLPPLALLLWRRWRPRDLEGWGADPAGLVAGALFALNPFVWSLDRLNPNLFALPLMLAYLALLADVRRTWPLAGLLLGVLAGIREEAVCFLPATLVWLLWGEHRWQQGATQKQGAAETEPFGRRCLRLCGLGAVTLLAFAPVLHWKAFAFGNPLLHPSQYAHFDGFRPEFAHSLFGLEFRFNGLFNWPLHDRLVRTPHFAFPTWFLWPLVTLRALGTVAAAVALLGLGALWRRARPLAVLCALWILPVYALFGPQENWEEVKMTFLLLAWPPLVPMLAMGLAALAQNPAPVPVPVPVPAPVPVPVPVRVPAPVPVRDPVPGTAAQDGPAAVRSARPWLRPLAGLALLTALLSGLAWSARLVDAPADPRWQIRFPNADPARNPAALAGLLPEERNDWRYFQSFETPAEIARERAKLTAGLPWPAPYLPVRFDPGAALQQMRAEAGEKRLRVLDIWGYIYGTRRWPEGVAPP